MGLSTQNYDGGLACGVSVLDFDKSIKWYTEVLGFTLLYRADELGWCEFSTPVKGVTVGLSQVEKIEHKGGNATLTWGVSNIEESRAELEKHDVKFDGDTQVIPDMVKICTFYDLDGNCFMLYQDISPKN